MLSKTRNSFFYLGPCSRFGRVPGFTQCVYPANSVILLSCGTTGPWSSLISLLQSMEGPARFLCKHTGTQRAGHLPPPPPGFHANACVSLATSLKPLPARLDASPIRAFLTVCLPTCSVGEWEGDTLPKTPFLGAAVSAVIHGFQSAAN